MMRARQIRSTTFTGMTAIRILLRIVSSRPMSQRTFFVQTDTSDTREDPPADCRNVSMRLRGRRLHDSLPVGCSRHRRSRASDLPGVAQPGFEERNKGGIKL